MKLDICMNFPWLCVLRRNHFRTHPWERRKKNSAVATFCFKRSGHSSFKWSELGGPFSRTAHNLNPLTSLNTFWLQRLKQRKISCEQIEVANVLWLTENIRWDQSFTFREYWGPEEETAFVLCNILTCFPPAFQKYENKIVHSLSSLRLCFLKCCLGAKCGARFPGRNRKC